MKPSRNFVLPIALSGVLVVLIGAYFMFQGTGTPSIPNEVATTTQTGATTTDQTPATTTPKPVAPAAPSTGGAAKPVVSPIKVTQSDSFKVSVDTKNLSVGSTFPKISMELPPGSNEKVLVMSLKPSPSSPTSRTGILLTTTINTSDTAYSVVGLKLKTATDPATGEKFSITAGTYVLETDLWDKTPFLMGGVYGNFAGNNGTGVVSVPFTISAAP
ncbi:MAG: hypothetical protein WAV21_03675 [Minisyncoccia bacterium]